LPEIRIDPLTGQRSIIAGARAGRPGGELSSPPAAPIDPESDPFADGHEDRTPPELYALRPGGGAPDTPGWQVRVVPNLYPALSEQPADPAAKLALAQALWLEQATDQATALASQVLATHPHSIVALMILLASELRRGRALRVRELQARIDAIEPGLVLHPEVASLLGLPVGK